MDFAGMNYWAVVFAAAASFIFGGFFYGVFGKQWLDALGKTEEEIKRSGYIGTMVMTFVAQLLMAFVLAGLIGHLGPGQVTLGNGIISAFFIWSGFVASTLTVNYSFQQRGFMLTLIDGVHWLCVLLIQGAIIGLLGV